MRKHLKRPLLIILIIIGIFGSFVTTYNSMIEDLKNTGNSKQNSINDYIVLSSTFMENMAIYGNSFFQQGEKQYSQCINMIKHDAQSNSYSLDSIGGTELAQSVGNISGLGSIPEEGIRKDELNLVFEYTEYFNKFRERLPDVAWLYYTSENNFIYMDPWFSTRDFKFSEDLKNSEFYKYVNPKNNPNHKGIWTPVYMDHAGKGLMVTLSYPVYNQNRFMGVVSLDLTNAKLSKLINSQYESYLMDSADNIIATNENVDDKNVTKFNTLLKSSNSDLNKMKHVKDGSVQRIGAYYVYTSGFNDAPWKLVVMVPVYQLVGKILMNILPIIIICLLLFMTFNEVENRKKTEKVLQNIAITDQLTGLNNRHYFEIKVVDAMKLSDIYNKPVSMVIFDLDHFKRINDNWGHPVGDEVLKQASRIMSDTLRKTDMLFRIGGEEFVALLPDTGINSAMEVAERLRAALDENTHPLVGKYTASFGVAERIKNESLNLWYKKADQALYNAKNQGRNRVVRALGQDYEII